MKFNEEDFKKLKAKVDAAKAEADRAEGAHQTLMQQLEEEFGVTTIKGAQTQLKLIQKEKEAAKKAYESAEEDYRSKWEEE